MEENYENYKLEDDDDEAVTARRKTLWSLMPQVMIMPTAGWEKVKNEGPSPEIASIRFLMPMSLLSGASAFFSYIYPDSSLQDEGRFTVLLVNAVIAFCSFFLGYYVALVMMKVFLPKDSRWLPSSDFGKLMTMTGIGTLAFFHIIFEAFPMLDFILVFLPLWTIFLIFRGILVADLHSDKQILAISMACLVIIASPTLIEWVLALFV